MSQENKKVRLLCVDYLKAIAIVFVVLGHSLTYYVENYGRLSPLGGVISLLICSVHVPLFFIVAGYLCHKQEVKKYIRTKCKRVLVPFVTFSALKLVYSAFIEKGSAHGETFVSQLVDAFLLGRLYWFAYTIFGIYLIAIWFWKKENESKEDNNKRIGIAVAILLIVNIIFACLGRANIFDVNVFQINYIIKNLPYFLIGYFIHENRSSCVKIAKNSITVIISFGIVVVFTILIRIQLVPNIYPVTFLMAACLSYIVYRAVALVKAEFRFITVVGKYSLQIMFFDSLMKVVIFAVVSRLMGVSTGVVYVIAVADIIISTVASYIIEKIPYVNRLFGL